MRDLFPPIFPILSFSPSLNFSSSGPVKRQLCCTWTPHSFGSTLYHHPYLFFFHLISMISVILTSASPKVLRESSSVYNQLLHKVLVFFFDSCCIYICCTQSSWSCLQPASSYVSKFYSSLLPLVYFSFLIIFSNQSSFFVPMVQGHNKGWLVIKSLIFWIVYFIKEHYQVL